MTRLRVIRAAPLSDFANLVDVYRRDLYRLWLISPWIGAHDSPATDPLQVIVDAVRSSPECMVNIITREPEAAYHLRALQLLQRNISPVTYYCASLHTKLYILEANGFAAAILGSPNLTRGGDKKNVELAIELRDTGSNRRDEVAQTLEDLLRYGNELITENYVRLAETL